MQDTFKRLTWGVPNTQHTKKMEAMLKEYYNAPPWNPYEVPSTLTVHPSSRSYTDFHSALVLKVISMHYDTGIKLASANIRGPKDSLTNLYIPKLEQFTNSIDPDRFTLFLIGCAPSVFKTKEIQNFRSSRSNYSSVQDSVFAKHSGNKILGIQKYNKSVIMFVNATENLTSSDQILCWILAHKMQQDTRPVPDHVRNFIGELTKACAELSKDWNSTETISKVKFKTIINNYIDSEKAFKIDHMADIKRFFKEKQEIKLKSAQKEYEGVVNAINAYLDEIAECNQQLSKISDDIARYQNLTDAGINKELEEFMDFLERAKTVSYYRFEEGLLTFVTKDFLYVNDPDQWDVVAANAIRNKVVLQEYHKKITQVLHDTLVENKYKLKTSATISLNLQEFKPARSYSIDPAIDVIPSPHIMGYNCWGTHSKIIANCLAKRDLVGLLEQVLSACAGLNAYDSPVVNYFVSKVWEKRSYKCFIETATKQEYTLLELIEKEKVCNASNAESETNNNV